MLRESLKPPLTQAFDLDDPETSELSSRTSFRDASASAIVSYHSFKAFASKLNFVKY